jgi:hypothetical protein
VEFAVFANSTYSVAKSATLNPAPKALDMGREGFEPPKAYAI